MILELALLGFLAKGAKSGYELQKVIEKSINHFWTSTQSQIYRSLSRMADDGLIESEIHYQDEKPNKKVYSITDKGREQLLSWLSSPIDIPSHRNPFLVQLFFSGKLDKTVIKSNLLHYKNEMEKRLGYLQSDEVRILAGSGSGETESFLYEALVDNGVSLLQSEIDWIDRSLRKLELSGE